MERKTNVEHVMKQLSEYYSGINDKKVTGISVETLVDSKGEEIDPRVDDVAGVRIVFFFERGTMTPEELETLCDETIADELMGEINAEYLAELKDKARENNG